MSDAPDLEMIQRQQRQIIDEIGEFRDQLTVLTAICMRVEGAVNALTTEVRTFREFKSPIAEKTRT
jgi:hypothetical protein